MNAAIIYVICFSCFDKSNCLSWKGSIVLKLRFLSESDWIIDSATFAFEKTHAWWKKKSLYLLMTLRLCHIKYVSCSMVKHHADQTSFEREPTEERRSKNTFMTGTLVTFKMTHQTPASHKDEDTNLPNWGNQKVMSVLKNGPSSIRCEETFQVLAQ